MELDAEEMDQRQRLQDVYGFVFPDEFFTFQRFAFAVGTDVLDRTLGLRLETPFFFISPDLRPSITPRLEWESRFYDDPPEFVTIFSGDTDGLHWGYYLDDPDAGVPTHPPVADFYSRDAFELSVGDGGIFAAVRRRLEWSHRSQEENREYDPDEAEYYTKELETIATLRTALMQYATGDRPEIGEEYTDRYSDAEERAGKVVAPTRDRAGIVLPPEVYRPIALMQDKEAYEAAILASDDTPDPIAPLAEEAMALLHQGYPGAALQLGKDLWLSRQNRETSYSLIDAAYIALNRPLLRRSLHIARECREYHDKE